MCSAGHGESGSAGHAMDGDSMTQVVAGYTRGHAETVYGAGSHGETGGDGLDLTRHGISGGTKDQRDEWRQGEEHVDPDPSTGTAE